MYSQYQRCTSWRGYAVDPEFLSLAASVQGLVNPSAAPQVLKIISEVNMVKRLNMFKSNAIVTIPT